ncbi:MAG: hypothetical protein ACRDR6_14780 [Pseudonocardiaceae bacterium]
MGGTAFEAAVAAGVDPVRRAYEIRRAREAVQSRAGFAVGNPAVIRDMIKQDWETMLRQGVDPRGVTPRFLDSRELESLQDDPDLALTWRLLVQQLGLVRNSEFMATVCDARGRVVRTGGNPKVRDEADRYGFRCGARWAEMGTNGIRMVAQSQLGGAQIYGPEHWLDFQARWTCTAAGVYDPRTRAGRLLAVINVTGPWAKVHGDTLGWLCLIARCIEDELRTTGHCGQWGPLVAAGSLDRIRGPALVIDSRGVVAAAHEWSMLAGDRVILQKTPRIAPGRAHLPPLGECVLEPLPGRGWLVRPSRRDEDQPVIRVSVDSLQRRVTVTGPNVSWESRVRPLHAKILQCLAGCREGLTADELQVALYGAGAKTCVSPEMSKLRKELGWLLHPPSRMPGKNIYRLADNIDVDIR